MVCRDVSKYTVDSKFSLKNNIQYLIAEIPYIDFLGRSPVKRIDWISLDKISFVEKNYYSVMIVFLCEIEFCLSFKQFLTQVNRKC